MIRLTKIFNFEMAHALYGYDGPCKNIHGHSYQLEVTIAGNLKDMFLNLELASDVDRNYSVAAPTLAIYGMTLAGD